MKLEAIHSALFSLSPEASQESDWPEISKVKKRDFSKFKV
jgi:menaquinone-dependent protoporphyrinogen IX oxidase